MDFTVVNEKLDQAVRLLEEQNTDPWLTFVRETTLTSDPCLDLVAGLGMTWHSAFIVSRSDERVAIVGRFDAENVRAIGGYTQVVPYDQSLRPALREAVARFNPRSIALNFSESDPAADGLTHGMWQSLMATFADTPFADRFVSAERFIAALRGRKSLGLGTAWDEPYCPIVNAGPDSPVGHTAAGQVQDRARPTPAPGFRRGARWFHTPRPEVGSLRTDAFRPGRGRQRLHARTWRRHPGARLRRSGRGRARHQNRHGMAEQAAGEALAGGVS